MSKSEIILWIFLPLLLVYFVFRVFFIPSWYNFQIAVGLSTSIIFLLIWIFRLRAYNKSFSKSGKKTAARVILSFWIFTCLLASDIKLFSGQDGEWFYGFELFERLTLKTEWNSKKSNASVYVFTRFGHWGGPVHVWLKKGKLPFMKRIWSIKGNSVDSISESGNNIRIYGYENYPFLKPILVTYNTGSEEIDIREDTMRTRALGAPQR
jgi:hypothetical protein